uniref:Cytochrome c oxidase subunit 3 n=1 Tax=Mirax sp. QL-2014 TaxID=1491721 RepID=A0A0U1WYN0_9HYME|nr:cytochrome c oxidase subunit III [Mirax sp. QL-2014]
MMKFNHPYHLVSFSPWPLGMSFSLMFMLMGGLKYDFMLKINLMLIGLISLLMCMFQWWRDVTRESTIQGDHTMEVVSGLKMGMLLFILSELMFFVSFFWGYFHMYLSPSIDIGSLWVPKYLNIFDPYSIPLENTLILLSSGVSVTSCHYFIVNKNYKFAVLTLLETLLLGLIFIVMQYKEYCEASFTISDSIYGGVFFMMTGFHGMHVIIGVVFLSINFIRLLIHHFSMFHHIGFEFAAWYWHFVDVVWLFLYMFIYWLPY